jgi:hypothetical protein
MVKELRCRKEASENGHRAMHFRLRPAAARVHPPPPVGSCQTFVWATARAHKGIVEIGLMDRP